MRATTTASFFSSSTGASNPTLVLLGDAALSVVESITLFARLC
jgi:hypothetical protein